MVEADIQPETPAEKRRRRIKKIFLNVLFAVLAIGAVLLASRLFHRRVLYQAPDTPVPAALPNGATLLETTASDGVPVHALHFAGTKAKRTIVHFHGNAELVDDNANLARELAHKGFDVVLVEYRGYGRSRGAPTTEEGIYRDATAVLDLLATRGVQKDAIVLFGQSLGTGTAAEMALQKRGARLVLVAPFTSTVDLARRAMPILPGTLVIEDRFDTLSKAPQIDVPALVVHGDADDVVPPDHGEQVSKALPKGHLLKVPLAGHGNIYRTLTVVSDIATFAAKTD